MVGTSIAYHLALLGATDVVLLERKQLTSGTTWHAAGEVVSGGTTEDALWMARYSAELYARLEEETGLSTGFRQCGYLQLATTARADESLRRETAYMRSVGMTKEVLSPREVADLVPLMRADDVVHGFWTPDEGRANPVDVTMSLAKGARQRGVRIFEDTEVTGFVLDRGRVVGVRTERGDVECEKVVLAAGLWGRELAAKAGVTVPLQAAEHYYLLTEPIAGVTPESVPVIEDGEAYGYYREEGGGLLVGMFEPVAAAWSLDGTPRDSAFAVLPPDWDRMAPFLEVAMRRFPALEDAGIRTLFCGPESFTDDLSPMLGGVAGGRQPLPRLRPELRRHPVRRRPGPHDGAVADRGAAAARRHHGGRRPGPRVPGDAAVPQGAHRRAARLPAQRPVVAERPEPLGVATSADRRTIPGTWPTALTSSPRAAGSTPTTSPDRASPRPSSGASRAVRRSSAPARSTSRRATRSRSSTCR